MERLIPDTTDGNVKLLLDVQVPGLVDRYMEGGTKLDKYISHEMPFEDINQAFDLLHGGDALRTVLQFPDFVGTPVDA